MITSTDFMEIGGTSKWRYWSKHVLGVPNTGWFTCHKPGVAAKSPMLAHDGSCPNMHESALGWVCIFIWHLYYYKLFKHILNSALLIVPIPHCFLRIAPPRAVGLQRFRSEIRHFALRKYMESYRDRFTARNFSTWGTLMSLWCITACRLCGPIGL